MAQDTVEPKSHFWEDIGRYFELFKFVLFVYLVYSWYKNGLGKYCWKLVFPITMIIVTVVNLNAAIGYPEIETRAYELLFGNLGIILGFTIIVILGRRHDARIRAREEANGDSDIHEDV